MHDRITRLLVVIVVPLFFLTLAGLIALWPRKGRPAARPASDCPPSSSTLWLAILFAVVVIAIGRLRGLAALVGLVITFAVLVKFVLPAILEGRSPMLVAIVGSAAVMFVIMYLAHGVNAQTTTALLGTLASLAIIGILSSAFVSAAHIFNLGTEEATFLQMSASQVDLRGLLLGRRHHRVAGRPERRDGHPGVGGLGAALRQPRRQGHRLVPGGHAHRP